MWTELTLSSSDLRTNKSEAMQSLANYAAADMHR